MKRAVNPDERVAEGIVRQMYELFGIDAEAQAQGLDIAARHELRQERAEALLDRIKAAIEGAWGSALPSSKLRQAARYTLGLWPKLVCFLEHPVLELNNNLAENSMWPIALGRMNWIHMGSTKARPKVAAILSLVESCRRMELPIRAYLADALPGLNDVSVRKIPELTPAAWAARRKLAQAAGRVKMGWSDAYRRAAIVEVTPDTRR